MKIYAPKPPNFEDLSRTWNDPIAFAQERAKYYASLKREVRDITLPLHQRDEEGVHETDTVAQRGPAQ